MQQLFRGVIHQFVSNDPRVLEAAWSCLNAVTKRLDTTDLYTHIGSVRQAVKFAASDLPPGVDELPGFCLPKKVGTQ